MATVSLPRSAMARRAFLVLSSALLLLAAFQSTIAADVSDVFNDLRKVKRATRESKSIVSDIKSITRPITAKRSDNLPSNGQQVVFYSASWCGYCNKARDYMDSNNVSYVEYDTEKSERGRSDFASLGARGVPVLLIGDERMDGWSENKFRRMHQRTGTTAAANSNSADDSGGIEVGAVLTPKIDNIALLESGTSDAPVLSRLKKGEEVVAMEVPAGDFIKVESAAGSGWIDARLLKAAQ